MYVVKLGFLDGAPGWHLARLAAYYEYMFLLMYRDKLGRIRGAAGSTTAARSNPLTPQPLAPEVASAGHCDR